VRVWSTWSAVCTACILFLFACSAGGTSSASEPLASPEIVSVAGLAGAPRAGHAFKNLDPAYKRASYYQRLHSLIVGGTWLVPESRVAREPHDEPPRRIAAEVSRRGLDPAAVWISKPGETIPW